MEVAEYLNEYNQVALDAIRVTGGNNATRRVMVPGYDASIDGCMIDAFKLPDDTAKDRLIVSVHAYTPYYFALATDVFEPEFDKSSKTDIDVLFSNLNDKFLSKGIPAVIGETEMAQMVYDLFMSINSLKKSGANISGITWWGLSDETTWISGQQPLLFSKPGVKKLAYGN